MTISDNEATRINLSVSPASVRESPDRTQTFTVTAAMAGAAVLLEPVTVNATVAGGAASGNGYRSLSPTSLAITIPARASSAQATFSVRIINDTTVGNTKTIRIT